MRYSVMRQPAYYSATVNMHRIVSTRPIASAAKKRDKPPKDRQLLRQREMTRMVPSALFSRKICPAAFASKRMSARDAGALPCDRVFS